MSNTMMKTFLLLMVLIFTMVPLIHSAPTAVDEVNFDENHIHSARNIAGTSAILAPLITATTAWFPGEPQSILIEQGIRDVNYKTCVPKPDDSHMCIVTFVQSSGQDFGFMRIYDNMCRERGYKDHVSRDEMADRYSMSSELPMYVDVSIDRKWTPYKSKGVQLWYGSYYSQNPFKKAPQQWLAQVDNSVLGSNVAGRRWFAIRVPFLCV